MFLLRDKGKKSLTGFLRRLIINALLIIHLLALLLLAAALAQPYLEVPSASSANNHVLILDNSASMQATDNGVVRYEQAKSLAADQLSRRNTIILAGAIPEVALEAASREEARTFLSNWRPSDQPTHLRPAILEAQRHAQEDTQVTIISDFRDTEENTNYIDAVQTLQALGHNVHLEHVGTTNDNNQAIVDVQARDTQTTVRIRNYHNQPTTLNGCVAGNCQEFSLEAQETQSWSFNTPPGVSEVTIDANDDLEADNQAYISAEEQRTIRTLIITNGDWEDSPLAQALDAIEQTTPMNFETTINRPPQLTDVNHDLIILHEINPDTVVSRTLRDAAEAVRTGAASIILHQEAQFAIPYEELIPVTYQDQGAAASIQSTDAVREYIGIEFGSTPTYYQTSTKDQARIIARSDEEHPVIVRRPLGAGNTLYYGLPPQASFTNNPEYPLFWKTEIDELLGRSNAQTLTRRTGEVINAQQPVRTPSGETKQGTILLDQAGVYTIGQRQVVANLANNQESNLNAPAPSGAGIERILTQEERTQEQNLTTHALWVLLALLLIELIYLKWRGDL